MKGAVLWGGVALVVIVVIGAMVYRSTEPNGDVVLEGESSLEEDAADVPTGQFIQLEPEDGPPVVPDAATDEPAADVAPVVDDSAAANPVSGETVTISMADTGFSPALVTVAVGTTVTFVNDGQALHWPASAVHPTHDVLPAFDSRRGVATGETYSYTFTQAGNWNFHDHLNPQFSGTVVVE